MKRVHVSPRNELMHFTGSGVARIQQRSCSRADNTAFNKHRQIPSMALRRLTNHHVDICYANISNFQKISRVQMDEKIQLQLKAFQEKEYLCDNVEELSYLSEGRDQRNGTSI